MMLEQTLALFSILDIGALALLMAGAWLIGWRIEHPPAGRPSLSVLMAAYRRDWMKQMVPRDPRIFDSQLIGNLRQGTAFFASATMIAIGGGLAAVGNTEQVSGVVSDLIHDNQPTIVWEIKILVLLVLLANAFLKFVWAHRLFGYCAVLMATVPNDPESPLALPRASQAADICITAARSFNRAMRSIYFALATVAWLLGPVPLVLAAGVTIAMLYRREFASRSRAILLRVPPDTDS